MKSLFTSGIPSSTPLTEDIIKQVVHSSLASDLLALSSAFSPLGMSGKSKRSIDSGASNHMTGLQYFIPALSW